MGKKRNIRRAEPDTLDVQQRLLELVQAIDEIATPGEVRDAEHLLSGDALERINVTSCGIGGLLRDPQMGPRIVSITVAGDLPAAARCTCERRWCAHIVATLIAWDLMLGEAVGRGAEVPMGPYDWSSRAIRGDAPAPKTPGTEVLVAPRPGASLESVGAWARSCGFEAEIERPVRTIAHELRLTGSAHWFATYDSRSVAELVAVPKATSRDVREVQDAVCRWLAARGDVRRKAEKAEKGRLADRPRPEDPAVARLFDAFEAERVSLRAAWPPLSPDGPTGRLGYELDPPKLVYEHSRESSCTGAVGGLAWVLLHGPESPSALTFHCACRTPRSAGCQLRLGLVEAALTFLSRPVFPDRLDALMESLGMLPWERILRALDRSLDQEEAAAAEGRVAFIVDDFGSHVRLRTALASPMKRGGFKVRKVGRRGLEGATLTRTEQHAVDLVHPMDASDSADCGPDATLRAIDLLVGHPMIFLPRGKEPVPLTREDASLVTERGPEGQIRLRVRLGERVVTPSDASYVLEDGSGGLHVWVAPDMSACAVLRVAPALVTVIGELARRGDELPAEATAALLQRLPRLSARIGVSVDPSLRGREESAAVTPHVRIALAGDGRLDVQVRSRPLPDASAVVPGEGYPEVFVQRDDGTVCGVRDLGAERVAAREVAALLGLHEDAEVAPHTWSLPASDLALDVVAASQELGDVEVLWADERRPHVSTGTVGSLKVKVGSGATWFSMGGGLETAGGVVPLGALLAAVRDEHRFVRVGDRQWVRIGDALRQQLEAAAHLARESEAGPTLPTLAAPLVDALREQGAEVQADSSWLALVERLRAADREEPPIPADLRAELRPYQAAGVRWMLRLSRWAHGACLADDMGLGKTVQALAVLLERAPQGPALVVAPTSVGFNWARESERFAPSLQVSAFRGRAMLDILELVGPGDVIVTSYELLARYDEVFHAIPFATVVLDEAQAIKNPTTLRARAAFGLDAGFVLALTGTPLENHTGELWSLFRAVAPGLLGSADDFQRRFSVPIERYRDGRARRALAYLARPFVLRRLKAEVAPELPPRTDVRVDVELSAAERRLYDELRASALAALAGEDPSVTPQQQRFQILAALTRLRQLACHPKLVDPRTTASSSKLRVLREIVAELRDGGHRALVFSQFTSLLALVREALEQDGATLRYLDGSTPADKRRAEVDSFQRGEADVFLLSLKAGGTGLNLTAADYVIHLDPWWNPAVEDQATDRAHRIGQESPVTVIRLVSKGTVEEGILAMHADKRELVDAVLEGTGAAASLSLDDMMALLAAGAMGAVDEEGEEPEAALVGEPDRERAGAVAPMAGSPLGDPPTWDGSPTWDEALARMEVRLARAVQAKELSSEATARSYLRVARRVADYATSTGVEPRVATLDHLAATYRQAVESRTVSAPVSDAKMAAGVLRNWLAGGLGG